MWLSPPEFLASEARWMAHSVLRLGDSRSIAPAGWELV